MLDEQKEVKNPLSVIFGDHGFIGAFLGLLAPLPGVYIYYLIAFHDRMSFHAFLEFVKAPEIFSKVLSLGLLINLPIFFLFIQLKHDRNSMTVLGATILYGAIIAYLKFLA